MEDPLLDPTKVLTASMSLFDDLNVLVKWLIDVLDDREPAPFMVEGDNGFVPIVLTAEQLLAAMHRIGACLTIYANRPSPEHPVARAGRFTTGRLAQHPIRAESGKVGCHPGQLWPPRPGRSGSIGCTARPAVPGVRSSSWFACLRNPDPLSGVIVLQFLDGVRPFFIERKKEC